MQIPKEFQPIREKLKKIKRYSLYNKMFYRTNVHQHSYNVYYLLIENLKIIKKTYPNFNENKAKIMALVHDDVEVLIGDFQAGNKAKLSKQEIEKLDNKEKIAIEKLSKKYPKIIYEQNYKQLLTEILKKNSIEAEIVKYLDRYDAFGEACHEIFAGNKEFSKHKNNEFGKIELPVEFYIKRFNNHKKTYPLITKLIQTNQTPFLEKYHKFNLHKIVKISKPHTKQNINKITCSKEYNYWKKVLIKHKRTNKLLKRIE